MCKAVVFCTIWVPLLAVAWTGTLVEVVVFSRTGGKLRTKQLEVGSFQVGLGAEGGTEENMSCISSGDLLPP